MPCARTQTMRPVMVNPKTLQLPGRSEKKHHATRMHMLMLSHTHTHTYTHTHTHSFSHGGFKRPVEKEADPIALGQTGGRAEKKHARVRSLDSRASGPEPGITKARKASNLTKGTEETGNSRHARGHNVQARSVPTTSNLPGPNKKS